MPTMSEANSDSVPPPAEGLEGAPRVVDGAMGRKVGSSAVWMVLATVIGKGASFIAQVLMGLLLVQEDFALFAYAASATKLLSICQDAGIKDLLIQEGAPHYRKLSGPIFWFAAVFNSGVGIFIALLTPLVAMYYEEPRLERMMWVLLLSIPLGTPSAVLSTKLRLDLRFKATSMIVMTVSVVRQVGQVGFALAGVGAMSFIYPAVIAAVLESALAWWISRDQPWTRPAEFTMWPKLVSRTKYLIMGSVANLLLDQGPYLVLQPSLRALGGMIKGEADILQGNVYWAFQMTAQVGVLLSYNMQLVLAPVFQRLRDDPVRLRFSIIRTLGALMMLGSITSVSFGVMMDPLEKMIFQGKWEGATLAVAIYGLFFPFRILYGLTTAAQLGTGKAAQYFWTTLIEGLAFTFSAVIAGALVKTPAGAAWWTGGTLAVSMIAVTLWVLKDLGISRREAIVEMCWPWILAVMAGGIGWVLDDSMAIKTMIVREWIPTGDIEHPLRVLVTIKDVGGVWGGLATWLQNEGLNAGRAARLLELVRFLIMGVTCSVSFLLAARVLMPEVLREVLRIAPGPFGRLGARALLIRDRQA